MATSQLMAGGGRRSAAPTYAPRAALTSGAIAQDDELVRQLVQAFQPAAVATATSTPSISELLGQGSSVIDISGQGGPSMGAADSSADGGVSPGTVGAIGTGLSALGAISGNASLGQIGGMMGLGGALGNAPSNEAALGIMGQAALGMMGVPGVGLASNAITGNVPGMVNAAISMANPAIGAVNALAGLLGIGTLGGLFGGGPSEAGTPGQSDVSNATGIEGLGFSDAAFGPPDSPSDGVSGVSGVSSDGQGPGVGEGTGGAAPGDSGDGGTGAASSAGGDSSGDGDGGGPGGVGGW